MRTPVTRSWCRCSEGGCWWQSKRRRRKPPHSSSSSLSFPSSTATKEINDFLVLIPLKVVVFLCQSSFDFWLNSHPNSLFKIYSFLKYLYRNQIILSVVTYHSLWNRPVDHFRKRSGVLSNCLLVFVKQAGANAQPQSHKKQPDH